MKQSRSLIGAAVAAAMMIGSATVYAQQGQGQGPGGMGPGMMGGPRGHMWNWGWGPGGAGPMHQGMGMGWGMMGGNCAMFGAGGGSHAAGRLAFIKAELGITDAQKAAWDGYAAALRKNFENMQAMHQTMVQSFEAKTPVERLDTRITAMDSRLAALKEMKPALKTLYDALSDDQKTKANDLLVGMGCMM